MFKLFSIPNTRKERGEDQDQRDQFQEGEGTEKRELRSTTKGRGGAGPKESCGDCETRIVSVQPALHRRRNWSLRPDRVQRHHLAKGELLKGVPDSDHFELLPSEGPRPVRVNKKRYSPRQFYADLGRRAWWEHRVKAVRARALSARGGSAGSRRPRKTCCKGSRSSTSTLQGHG